MIDHKQGVTNLTPAGFLAAVTALTAIASADPPFPRKPPQQAIDACANASANRIIRCDIMVAPTIRHRRVTSDQDDASTELNASCMMLAT